jgi:hypothetical protein
MAAVVGFSRPLTRCSAVRFSNIYSSRLRDGWQTAPSLLSSHKWNLCQSVRRNLNDQGNQFGNFLRYFRECRVNQVNYSSCSLMHQRFSRGMRTGDGSGFGGSWTIDPAGRSRGDTRSSRWKVESLISGAVEFECARPRGPGRFCLMSKYSSMGYRPKASIARFKLWARLCFTPERPR